jgi:hypothetical protein
VVIFQLSTIEKNDYQITPNCNWLRHKFEDCNFEEIGGNGYNKTTVTFSPSWL